MESLTSIGENFFFSNIQPYLRDTMCSQILLNSHFSVKPSIKGSARTQEKITK